MTVFVLKYASVLNKKYPSERQYMIYSRRSFWRVIYWWFLFFFFLFFPPPLSLVSSSCVFSSFVYFYSSCMLPNLLQCKCLQEARYLAYPRVTLVLLYRLPASTQTRAQTALHPKARYCTRPGGTAILTMLIFACMFFFCCLCASQL